MKKLYWHPRGISRPVLVLIALASLAGLLAVELLRTKREQPHFAEKLQAARLALEAMDIVKQARLARNMPIDPSVDPAQSGLIGLAVTPVTTVTGSVPAKQTSINPNFAALVVQMLREAGVQPGDVIAVGCSGSFPALNICVCTAARTLGLKPILISSISASQFGANDPGFLWIDMEGILHDRDPDRFPYRTAAASLGGIEDRALGLSDEGRQALLAAAKRHGLAVIEPADFTDSIDQRMAVYKHHARGAPIKAYVNVGGGTISVGSSVGKRMFGPGLNLRKPPGIQYADSVMTRFIEQGVPVIHLTRIEQLAEQFGLPVQPTTIPPPGQGRMFHREEYNAWLAGGVLVGIILSLYAGMRTGAGVRLRRADAPRHDDLLEEPMV